tara:strand:- start:250 stop:894 length:645 start_codon:yes stop_codon:yes gene_type:complete
MKEKIILSIAILSLLSLAIFVSAATMEEKGSGYEVTVHLSQGWNLIAGTVIEDGISENSDIGLNDIDAMWYYSPLQRKYLEVYPNTDWDGINQDDEDFALTNAMWIYSKDSGNIKYNTLEDYPPLESRQLYSGWNLVSMTPDMIESQENPDLTFEEITGDCNVEKAYYFFDGNWVLFDMPEMDSTLLGKGMAIKVTQNCKLGKTGSSTTPPALP